MIIIKILKLTSMLSILALEIYLIVELIQCLKRINKEIEEIKKRKRKNDCWNGKKIQMNKYQIKLDYIKNISDDYDDVGRPMYPYKYDASYKDSVDTLQELIDKSTPKKFKKVVAFSYMGKDYYNYQCPCCNEIYDFEKIDYKYCPYCGQQIDWSDYV